MVLGLCFDWEWSVFNSLMVLIGHDGCQRGISQLMLTERQALVSVPRTKEFSQPEEKNPGREKMNSSLLCIVLCACSIDETILCAEMGVICSTRSSDGRFVLFAYLTL